MNTLTYHDLQFALLRTPRLLLRVMKTPEWSGRIFVGGGFLRSIVAGDPINDVDVFVSCAKDAEQLARVLVEHNLKFDKLEQLSEEQTKQRERAIHKTENAYTLTCFKPAIQIIHRWTFAHVTAVADSFDFTCCCAAFTWEESVIAGEPGKWVSYCDPRFYPDVAAKRLIYRAPKRNEDAGGSMLRVLKYYQKGYRIPVDSLGAVIGRLMSAYDISREEADKGRIEEAKCARIVTGLLREVDPNIDPSHIAHLPAEETAHVASANLEAEDNEN